ncbi:MAG: Crp/Fnr family transcriptional regulator, partial [Bacteroidota bacterium]
EQLKQSGSHWHNFIESLVQNALKCKMERVNDFLSLKAVDRYLKFQENHPKLAQNFSIETIASYIGIAPQSLSRIRRQLAE